MSYPVCTNTECASCKHNELNGRNECIALDACLMDMRECPFFKTSIQAEADKEAARIRVEPMRILAKDGTYKQQRFVHAKRIEDDNGNISVVYQPNIYAWLEDLVLRGTVPQDVLTKYMAANPA